MLVIKRLFWKIFLAFWLSSMMVMFLTTYVVLELTESSYFNERHREYVTEISEWLVNRYEQGLPLRLKRGEGSYSSNIHGHRYKNFRRHYSLNIINEQGQKIFSYKPKRMKASEEISVEFMSQSGKSYTTLTQRAPPPKRLIASINRLNSFRIVFIFFASGMVSFFLSWIITRPLKRLGVLSQRFADGELSMRVDKLLLERGDEIGDLARDFNIMAEKISDNINFQQNLLHDVSHELRAPLARLRAAAALIDRKNDKKNDTINPAARIDLECERLDELIQQILDFSRLDQDDCAPQLFSVTRLLGELIESTKFEFGERNILYVEPSSEVTMLGFQERFRRALENIIRNACKYTPQDTKIQVSAVHANGKVTIEVRDFGPGVATYDLERLNQAFYRGGNKMHSDGFGLGLSIAQKAVDKHKGRMEISSPSDGGLLVRVVFPIFESQ